MSTCALWSLEKASAERLNTKEPVDVTTVSLTNSFMVQLATLLSSTADRKRVVRRYAPLLELLHPNGIIRESFVIGSNAPAVSVPASRMPAGEDADLVILAPTATECHTAGWLETAVWSLARKIELDGIAYVLTPPPWRARVKRLLRHHGLVIGPSILHLPNRVSSRYLVPLAPILARYACANVLPLSPLGRRLAMLALRLPGAQKLLENVLPSAAFVARPAGAHPLFGWLFRLDGEGDRSGSAVISRSWRSENGGVILHRFLDGDNQPSAIAKMNLGTSGAAKRIAEAATLARLGPSARRAGAQVPKLLILGRIDNQPVLLQTVVAGRTVAPVLASRPNSFVDIMERLVIWLEHWNLASLANRPLDCELLDREIIAPAALLSPLLEQGKEYQDWLAMRCAMIRGLRMPFVATHNDLTMWNVLLDEQGRLGVVDWESAREDGFPLVDFFYAVTDAVMAAEGFGYSDRPQALVACFTPNGAYALAVRRFVRRLRNSIEISDEIAELCFHAGWLHHAANEHRSSGFSDPRPFLKIVQSLARYRSHFTEWMNS